MAISTADTQRQPGEILTEPAGQGPATSGRATFAPTLALTATIAFGAFAVAMALVLLFDHPTPLPPPLAEQNQDAETLLFLLAFGVILPLALFAAPRLADRISAGPNGAALPAITGLLAASLAAAILIVKLSTDLPWGDGLGVVLGAAGVWWLAAIALLARAAGPRPWPALLRVSGIAPAAWALVGVLVFGTLLCLTALKSVSPVGLALGLIVLVAVLVAGDRIRLPPISRPWRIAADVVVVALVLLAVPDLVIFRPEEAPGNLAIALETGIIGFHQNFLLGPANQVLAGHPMLVDTASQYGVGSIYLLAGWFNLAPIGYGTLGFLSGGLSALVFAGGYGLLRISGSSRVLAASALGVAVISLVFNLAYPINSIPQDAALRFGLPMVLLLATVGGERWPRFSVAARVTAFLVVGVSAIWALEAFAYTVAVFVAMACMQAWLLPAGQRRRWLARQAIIAALAAAGAHLLFAGATLAVSGQLPDWGQYLAYLKEFLFGNLGDLTYDFTRWSPGLAVGAGYLGSAAAIVLLVLRKPEFVRRERVALVALSGITAYGIGMFSYFVNRSTDQILASVGLPALLTGAIWLSLLLRSTTDAPRSARRGGLAFGLSVGILLVAVAWSSIGGRYPRSALAHVLPGGGSLKGALHRLWHPPALNSAAPAGQQMLERYMPGERQSLVLLTPDLGTEILIRSGRANDLPLADPWQDSFVASVRVPSLRSAVSELRPGDRMLTDRATRQAFVTLQRNPSIAPLSKSPAPGSAGLLPEALAPLQLLALKQIGNRFRLRTIHRDPSGFTVVELIPRR